MNRREAIATLMALPATARLNRAAVKPDDVVVVETDAFVTEEAKQVLAAQLKKIWPNNKVVVCDGGLRLKIVTGGSPNVS